MIMVKQAELLFESNTGDLGKIPMKVQPKILGSWGSYMLRETHQRFRDEESPEGTPWAKRKIFAKSKRKRSFRTLYGTGTLFRSIKYVVHKTYTLLFSNLPYAGVHQKGGTWSVTKKQSVWMWANLFGKQGAPWRFKKITMPARPFLGFSGENIDKLEDIAASHMLKELS